MDPISLVLFISILVLSVVIHEIAHGYTALSLGDHTAKMAGRLTLNPLPHIDLVGSIVVPLFSILSFGYPFGWAKPVPVNSFNLRDRKYGSAKVSFAGPAANLGIFLIFGLILRFFPVAEFSVELASIFTVIAALNLILAYFNLLPIPPLDGSHIFFSFTPPSWRKVQSFLFQYGFYILLGLIILDYTSDALGLPISPLRFLLLPVDFIFGSVVGFHIF